MGEARSFDVAAVLDLYDVEHVSWSPMAGGNTNISVLVEGRDGARWVLTRCMEHPMEAVEQTVRLLEHVNAHGVRTNEPVRTRNGDLCGLWQGRPVLLKTWVDGQVFESLGSVQLEAVGKSLARLHGVGPCEGLARGRVFGVEHVASVVGSGLDPEFEALLERRVPALLAQWPQMLPVGVVHGDLFADNVVFTGDGSACLLDFEEASMHTLAFDVAMTLLGCAMEPGGLSQERSWALLGGYERVRKLDVEERAALGPLMELCALACGAWRLWRYGMDRPDPQKLHHHRPMMRAAQQMVSCPASFFMPERWNKAGL